MPTTYIPYRDTNYFSSLICDYLDESDALKPLYNRFPKIENFKAQIEEKSTSFPSNNRKVLVNALKQQYQHIETSKKTSININALSNNNTFTVVTGHQLNLFTGPLYFLYKIISTINLTEQLKNNYPNYHFVPVYWMASEDHDFEEINHFNLRGKKIQWNREASGAVGRLNTEGLNKVYDVFEAELGYGRNAEYIEKLYRHAYINHNTLIEATRYLANELFKDYGLVIIDGDDSGLKKLFVPYVEKELTNNLAYDQVCKTNLQLEELQYKIQVNPREINLFYLTDTLRERIVENNGRFYVNNTEISFTKDEIFLELEKHPERFSPNAIMRPLYQEVILPNLCYIGGGGELAYWLQLKSYFESVEIPFPMLLLRNSVLINSMKQLEKLKKLGLSLTHLFLDQEALVKQQTEKLSDIEIDFSPQKEHLKKQFEALYDLADKTDKSFVGAVAAQERKQIKGLEHLEKRLLKAQKRKLADQLERITDLQNQLFPAQSLQERNMNFSELYFDYGAQLIAELKKNLEPLRMEFLVLTI